jgi:hypothetical protein
VKLHKVIICGDREFRKEYAAPIRRVVRKLKAEHGRRLLVIEGEAPGVDSLVRACCKREGVHCAGVAALWDHYHRSAGAQRNSVMLGLDPHEVIGIHVDFSKSVGTVGMLKIAKDAGVPTRKVKVKS